MARRRQSVLSKVAGGYKRKAKMAAVSGLYEVMWGTTPQQDWAKTRRNKKNS